MIAQQPHSGERDTPTREPSELDTRMGDFRQNPKLHAQLFAKLEEYQARNTAFDFAHPELVIALSGVDPQLEQFKEKILEAVLWLVEDTDRDFEANPIMIVEIAGIIMDETQENIAEAVTIPFVWNEEDEEFLPDTDRLVAEVSRDAANFAVAYGVIRAYTLDKAHLAQGGKGLPVVEFGAIDPTD